MEKVSKIIVWEGLRDEMRKLRGRNAFRGNEELLLPKDELRIHFENRDSQIDGRLFIIHLQSDFNALWAEEKPSGKKVYVGDFEGDWKAWLSHIVACCKGKAYMHTNSQSADYRHPSTEDQA